MRIAIVGPGAMGCLFTAYLAKSNDVFLIDRNKKRKDEIAEKGIRVKGISNFKIKDFKITLNPKTIGSVDLIIVFVKAYDTEKAVKSLHSIITKNTYILTLQNGLYNIEKIEKYVERKNIIAGITNQGATLLGPGIVRHAGYGETIIGSKDMEKNSSIELIASILNKSIIETKTTEDVKSLIWSKLLINVGINALATILRVKNGYLKENLFAREILKLAVNEAEKVAKAKRVYLIYKNPVKKVLEICSKTKDNINSMLQDVLNKKKTEIDFINGAIVEEGRKIGISTPVNEVLTFLIKSIESNY